MEYSDPLPELKLVLLVSTETAHDEGPRQSHSRPSDASPQLAPNDNRWVFGDEFLDKVDLAYYSRQCCEKELRRFFRWIKLPLDQVTVEHLKEYRDYLVDTSGAIQSGTAKRYKFYRIDFACSIIQTFFNWLKTNHKDFPDGNFTSYNVPLKISSSKARLITEDEFKQIWKILEGLDESRARDKAIIYVLNHGLAVEEVVNLDINNFASRSLFVMTKRTGNVRHVPLAENSSLVLVDYLNWRQGKGESLSGDSPLFINLSEESSGNRLLSKAITPIVRHIGKLAAILDLEPIHGF